MNKQKFDLLTVTTTSQEEQVLVIKRELFDQLPLHDIKKSLEILSQEENYLFIDKSKAENSFDYKQLVVYTVVAENKYFGRSYKNCLSKYYTKYFSYKRCKNEDFPNGDVYSIGVGGHINNRDVEKAREMVRDDINTKRYPFIEIVAYVAFEREVSEEFENVLGDIMEKCSPLKLETLILNDETNNLGKKHLGIVCSTEICVPISLEKDTLNRDLKCLFKEELKENIHKYEEWSKILIKDLNE